jgi:hypothetical protein
MKAGLIKLMTTSLKSCVGLRQQLSILLQEFIALDSSPSSSPKVGMIPALTTLLISWTGYKDTSKTSSPPLSSQYALAYISFLGIFLLYLPLQNHLSTWHLLYVWHNHSLYLFMVRLESLILLLHQPSLKKLQLHLNYLAGCVHCTRIMLVSEQHTGLKSSWKRTVTLIQFVIIWKPSFKYNHPQVATNVLKLDFST